MCVVDKILPKTVGKYLGKCAKVIRLQLQNHLKKHAQLIEQAIFIYLDDTDNPDLITCLIHGETGI